MSAQAPRGFIPYLVFTAVVSGALVMVVEVLGSRVIGPFFGVSLFVWTALIGIALVSLAAGYAFGGWLADRHGSPDWLYGIILAAGLVLLLVPLMKGVVLKASVPLGLRAGTLAASLVLFGPTLFLLGCVSPFVVKIAAREFKTLGRTVGGFYALSTLGSFVGTTATGFFLIGYVGVDRTLVLTSLVLIAIAAVYFAWFHRRFAALAALLAPLVLWPGQPQVNRLQPDGTQVSLAWKHDSFYGTVKVVDYRHRDTHVRELTIDGLVQGGVDMRTGESIYEYTYLLTGIPYLLNTSGRDCLVIGLGAGTVPKWFEARGVNCETVDIDPEVVTAARRFFGFRGNVVIDDARYFLVSTRRQYDYIVLDAFNGDTTPGHLVSVEALRLMKERMKPGGVFAFNFHGSLTDRPFMTHSVIRTVREVFANVEVFLLFDPAKGDRYGNMVVVAYEGPRRAFNPEMAGRFPVHPLAEAGVRSALRQPWQVPKDAPSIVLTDDYNPLDFYDVDLKETVRRNILETTDWDILLS